MYENKKETYDPLFNTDVLYYLDRKGFNYNGWIDWWSIEEIKSYFSYYAWEEAKKFLREIEGDLYKCSHIITADLYKERVFNRVVKACEERLKMSNEDIKYLEDNEIYYNFLFNGGYYA